MSDFSPALVFSFEPTVAETQPGRIACAMQSRKEG
jgi:hypothetical protein